MVSGLFEFVWNNEDPGFEFSGAPMWEKYFEEF